MKRPQLGIRIDHDVYELLNRLAPTPKSKGELVSRLLYEHERCLFERRKFRERLGELVNSLSEENIAV